MYFLMCFEIPFKIVELKGKRAKAKAIGRRYSHRISLELLKDKDIRVGDYVMVQAGFVISKVEKEVLQELMDLLKIKTLRKEEENEK